MDQASERCPPGGNGADGGAPEAHRPRYHFSPPSGWMNDPCGLVYFQGEWHLFYQHNPSLALWGNIHWGHAVSTDLVRWTHLPLALKPHPELGLVFTGSVVADQHNTSGLCQGTGGCLVALFTHHGPGTSGKQQQSLAHSGDRGRTWTLYPGNPVIPNPGQPDFRDPKVFWHAASSRWVMVLAVGKQAWLYASMDLRSWTKLSAFGPVTGVLDGVWECPELLQVPEQGGGAGAWVLKVDISAGIGVKGEGRCFVGQFDGARFSVTGPASGSLLEGGEDFYAAQTFFAAPDGRRVWLGWLDSWQYALATPTTAWRGVMSLPRELALLQHQGQPRLVQAPARELSTLREPCHLVDAPAGPLEDAAALLQGVSGDSLLIQAELLPGSSAEVGFQVLEDHSAAEHTLVGYDTASSQLFLDRTRSGQTAFSAGFPARHAAPLALDRGLLKLEIYLDRSTVEVFANGGLAVISDRVYPGPAATGLGIHVKGSGARVQTLKVRRLRLP